MTSGKKSIKEYTDKIIKFNEDFSLFSYSKPSGKIWNYIVIYSNHYPHRPNIHQLLFFTGMAYSNILRTLEKFQEQGNIKLHRVKKAGGYTYEIQLLGEYATPAEALRDHIDSLKKLEKEYSKMEKRFADKFKDRLKVISMDSEELI